MQDSQRPGHHQPGQALVQGRTPLRADQRSLHGDRRVGKDQQGRAGPRPGDSRKRMARTGVERAVRGCAAGDAGARPEGAETRQGGKPLPAERAAEVRSLRQALPRPGSQERPVRLLHLRDPVHRGSGDVQRPLPERPQAGDVCGGEDTGAHSQRGDHRGLGAAGGRGDRRHGRGACRPTGGGRGGAVRREEAAWEALRGHRDERVDP